MEDRRKASEESVNGEEEEEEEYIDMELLCTSSPSSSNTQQSREFEFQLMSHTSTTKPTTTSSADELFFNGHLLPLHRHAAPPESCRPSCDLTSHHGDDDFFEWSNELNSFIHPTINKTPHSKKLKLVKLTSIVALKLRASSAFLKSFFSKSPCSDAIEGAQNLKASKIPTIASIMKMSIDINEENLQRRSFSGAVKRHSSSASSSGASSSSSSFSLNDQLHFLRRSTSATEIEGSIEAAIAHCKKSHQL